MVKTIDCCVLLRLFNPVLSGFVYLCTVYTGTQYNSRNGQCKVCLPRAVVLPVSGKEISVEYSVNEFAIMHELKM